MVLAPAFRALVCPSGSKDARAVVAGINTLLHTIRVTATAFSVMSMLPWGKFSKGLPLAGTKGPIPIILIPISLKKIISLAMSSTV